MIDLVLGILFVGLMGLFVWFEFFLFAGEKENDCKENNKSDLHD
jgi:hypothetical protein